MNRFAIVGNLAIAALIFIYPVISPASGPPINRIKLPPGFTIDVYAVNVKGARSMALGSNGTVFVGTRGEGKVYALLSRDGKKAEEIVTIASGLGLPNGVAFHNGSLYVAEITRVIRYDNIENRLDNPPAPVVINDNIPDSLHHNWRYIAFAPDGRLYISIGAPCNVCLSPEKLFATIARMNPDGTGLEIFASGVRNSMGFDWDPSTGKLWFTDNGRDLLGDNVPADELNYASSEGLHFGFPYCHGKNVADPQYGKGRSCGDYVSPAVELPAHVAALGMRFYSGRMFPQEYRNGIFIAEHGSWNRTSPTGYRVSVVRFNADGAASYETFAEGWLDRGRAWGRPVDILPMPDGSILISDDKVGAVYRISYE
ncbi:MAG: sorbosone dehydrogenase [Elusimicrobia bacterium RIFOXYB2_FULL_49_7]|nr:MAG: sorbosone dehydrogenase [Elusimicrobia bacterium RIFOXYB2_FULL_49_7]